MSLRNQSIKIGIALFALFSSNIMAESTLSGNQIATGLDNLVEEIIIDVYGSEADSRGKVFTLWRPSGIDISSKKGVLDVMSMFVRNSYDDQLGLFVTDDEFFKDVITGNSSYEEYRAQFVSIKNYMQAHLTDIHVAVLGEANGDCSADHPIFIMGKARDGSIVGIAGFVIWT